MREWLTGAGWLLLSAAAGVAITRGQTTWVPANPWIPWALGVPGLFLALIPFLQRGKGKKLAGSSTGKRSANVTGAGATVTTGNKNRITTNVYNGSGGKAALEEGRRRDVNSLRMAFHDAILAGYEPNGDLESKLNLAIRARVEHEHLLPEGMKSYLLNLQGQIIELAGNAKILRNRQLQIDDANITGVYRCDKRSLG